MPTFLWVPEEHPEEQYADIQEQAKVSDAARLIPKTIAALTVISLDMSDIAMRHGVDWKD